MKHVGKQTVGKDIVTQDQTGPDSNQLPTAAQLGAMAFSDTVGVTQPYLHTPDLPNNSVWRERISDTETVLKYKGVDGVVRSRQELWL